jgi:hypothetical protein
MTDEELAAAEAARQNLVQLTLLVTRSSQPIPTQDELNQMRLGQMTPDAIADPGSPEMPPTYVQEQYIQNAIDNAGTPPPPIDPVTKPVPLPPTAVDAPYVSGTGTVGSTLAATMGNWTGSPTSYAYQWQSDGTNLAGATGASYVVAASDSGHSLTCIVTATNAAGSGTAPPSNAVTVDGAARAAPAATARR